MKNAKIKVLACLILVAPVLFVSATWEGSADVAPGRNLHGEVYGIATNSFPRNTVVDVTNLENNRAVRVLVVSGQGNAGLLATLSRSAANSIGMDGASVHRVRITQPSDDIAFAHIRRGPLPALGEAADPEPAGTAADPSVETGYADVAEMISYEPAIDEVATTDEEAETIAYAIPDLEPEEDELELIAYHEEVPPLPEPEMLAGAEYLDEEHEPPLLAEAIAEYTPEDDVFVGTLPDTPAETTYEPARPPPTVMHEPQIYIPDFRFSLIPTEERLPPVMREHIIGPEYIIPPVQPAPAPREAPTPVVPPPPALVTPIIPPPAPLVAPVVIDHFPWVDPIPYTPRRPFQAVSSLERDKWYVQLGAFRYTCSVEEEISRIGATYPYPVLVQNIGTESDPMFRVLLGPLNQGESAAVLRRIRSVGNTQAFVRQAR